MGRPVPRTAVILLRKANGKHKGLVEYEQTDVPVGMTALTCPICGAGEGKTGQPSISGPSSMYSYNQQNYSVASGYSSYEWSINGACPNVSGQGTQTVQLMPVCGGTMVVKCRVKNSGENWSDYDTHNVSVS